MMFRKALKELGHDPVQYERKRLSLKNMSEIYEIEEDAILDAIHEKLIPAHYDYISDTIWIEALDAAHFYYCIKNEANLYAP
jgi:hypothetical protein